MGAQWLIATLLGAGVALRLGQYFANGSLWLDEAALARNVLDRTPAALWAPLDYAQVAPIGFLLAQKGATVLLGTSEYALRAFPLASGLLALFLFRTIAVRVLTGWAIHLAVGLFALATPLVYFSSQVKQYSSDVAAAVVLLLVAIDVRSHGLTLRRAVWLGLAGAAIAWVSQPALFMLAGISIAFVVLRGLERDWRGARDLVVMLLFWGSSAAAAGLNFIHRVPAADREFLRWFWADGFWPWPPQTAADLFWFFNKLVWAFGAFGSGGSRLHGGLNYRWSALFTVVMLVGVWTLFKRRRDVAFFITVPILLVAGLSVIGLYPFTARLFTFLLPGLLLATAAGAASLLINWPARLSALAPVLIAIVGGAPIYAAATALPPYWMQHVRPILEQVRQRWQSGDGLYVYFASGQAYRYYAPRFDLPSDDVVVGQCAVGSPREYLRELDRFRGRQRLWIVITHAHYEGAEMKLILDYLDTIGRRVDQIPIPGSSGRWIEGAWGYLYDLGDATRLGSSSAETFPLSVEGMPEAGPWKCYGVFLSEPASARSGRS